VRSFPHGWSLYSTRTGDRTSRLRHLRQRPEHLCGVYRLLRRAFVAKPRCRCVSRVLRRSLGQYCTATGVACGTR
jgi:hypothetical protein